VYADVLKVAMRSYYYQRCGTAKQNPFVDNGYADGACHIGAQKDKDCRLYNNANISTSKDLSGGWHDAGDYNKYVNFAWPAVVNLLLAYEQNPTVWFDNYGIPESGNGIPDILDEIKYEMDWLLKMQNSNGSVLCMVGTPTYGSSSPPSSDTKARVYGPATTTASYSAAGMFALAAIQFKAAGQTAYAATLQTAAINAWTWANANPNITFYNTGNITAGEQELNAGNYPDREFVRKISAAIYIYALTGTASYKTYIENNYTTVHLVAWGSAQIWEAYPQYAMLYYAALPGATPAVRTNILNSYAGSMEISSQNLLSYTNKTDAYMAYLEDNAYSWGVNQAKGDMASMFLDMNYYNLNAANATNYKNAAAGYVHYFHGVNPISKTYLSNMGNYGAENSATTIYHLWFDDGTQWDEVGVSTYGPASGIVPGGPNKFYTQNVTPPANQPTQKSYADFNGGNNAYEVTENGIYYQAGYIRMLSNFVSSSCGTVPTCDFQPLPCKIQGESYCVIHGIQTERIQDV